MTKEMWVTDQVKKKIDDIALQHGIHKEGLVDAILRLNLWDDAKVNQAVIIVKAYGLQGATTIESMSRP